MNADQKRVAELLSNEDLIKKVFEIFEPLLPQILEKVDEVMEENKETILAEFDKDPHLILLQKSYKMFAETIQETSQQIEEKFHQVIAIAQWLTNNANTCNKAKHKESQTRGCRQAGR